MHNTNKIMTHEEFNLFTAMTESFIYPWSDEYKLKNIRKQYDKIVSSITENVDFCNLSKEDCEKLHFGNWDDNLQLIPLYLLNKLPNGMKVISIFGEELIVGKDKLDNDHRGGYSAYGIIPVK